MDTRGTKENFSAYSSWVGKPIVLLVLIRQHQVAIACSIVGESSLGVHIRIEPGWEMNLRKDSILAVEEDGVALGSRPN